jgi:hypothetical protein
MTEERTFTIQLTTAEWLTVTDELADSIGELENCMEHDENSKQFYGSIRDKIAKAYIQLIDGFPQPAK